MATLNIVFVYLRGSNKYQVGWVNALRQKSISSGQRRMTQVMYILQAINRRPYLTESKQSQIHLTKLAIVSVGSYIVVIYCSCGILSCIGYTHLINFET